MSEAKSSLRLCMASVLEMPYSSRVSAIATSSEGRWENLGPTRSNVCSNGNLALAADKETGALFSTMARLSCVLGNALLLATFVASNGADAVAAALRTSPKVLLLCMTLPFVATLIIKPLPLRAVVITASEPFQVMAPSLLLVVMSTALPACVLDIDVIRAMLCPAVGLLIFWADCMENVEPVVGSVTGFVVLLLLIIETMEFATLSSTMELPVVRGVEALSMLLGLRPGVAVDTPEYMRET
mmetsp:Transcript_20233/g.47225  ORF Transcript_20233/g.47225 Transcript_20233/m.47225 type:complete len:242 (-) Transcript_20233:325-1050(-)